ncbi:MAG: hypothetical protein P1U56_04355 [Saprospiraceae bacterium]|nr:hypothetical protein [Saprospiraceae bacterium]
MKSLNGIILHTPKGQEVWVNFDNVAYCIKTSNNNISIRFTFSQGKESKGAYLVVVENLDQIQLLLRNE